MNALIFGLTHAQPRKATARGFTLVELLAVLAILALLGITLLPAFARSGANSRGFQCASNLRQLGVAWRLYADDNRDYLVYGSDDGTGASNPANKYAWTTSHMDYDPGNTANWDPNIGLAPGPLWPYSGRNAALYRCPSDESTVIVNGVLKPRVRSVAMNFYFGAYAGNNEGTAPSFRLFFKMSDLSAPGPAMTFVFLDEREDRINWGSYYTDMTGYPNAPNMYQFNYDMPGYWHDGGGNFVFGDGHTETHRWVDPRTMAPQGPMVNFISVIASPRNADIAWMQARSTAPK